MRGLVLVGLMACMPQPLVVPRVIPEPPAAREAVPAPPVVRVETAPPSGGPQLPRDFVPVGYRARLVIGTSIEGHVEITGDVTTPTSRIWLHAREIDVVMASAKRDAESVAFDVAYAHRAGQPEELLALSSAKPLPTGRWVVTIDYRAKIVDPDPGAYASVYDRDWLARATVGAFRETNGGQPYVFTQFESMFARRVFPCVDEPWNKVPWQLTLDVPAHMLAASNTPIARETALPNNWKRVEFAPTPPLPSYLIAFAVGPFDTIDAGKAKTGMPIRFLVPRGTAARYASLIATTAPVLDRLEAWFGIPYPYTKLDLVAVPVLSPLTGMENPGLITFTWFAERFPHARQEAISLVAHELAHQWLGNLVTPVWWDDIWLNESLATWMTSKITTSFVPVLDIDRQIAHDATLQSASFSVRAPLSETDGPMRLSPYLWGWHGAQIIRMVEGFIGAEKLQRAIQAYLHAHAHGTVTTADLVAAIDVAAGSRLDPIFADYLDKPGFPKLTAELRCAGHPRLVLSLDEPRTTPVCVAYDKDGTRDRTCVVIDHRTREVPLAGKACPRWVMPNADADGFYETSWTKDALIAVVEGGWTALTPKERDEVFANVDELPPERQLAFAARLVDAGDENSLAKGVEVIDRFAPLVPDDRRAAFDAWIETKLAPRARAIGFELDDPDVHMKLRIVELVARAKDPVILANAAKVTSNTNIDTWSPSPAVAIAASNDPAIALRIIDAAARGRSFDSILEHADGIVDLLTANPTKLAPLPGFVRMAIGSRVCSAAHRDAALALVTGNLLPVLRARIDDCIKRRDRLAPAFRAWLKSATP